MIAHCTCATLRRQPSTSPAGSLFGADRVEMDVRVTSDGVPLLVQDSLLVRTARLRWTVARAPHAVVRRLPLRGSAEPIPTLEEVLDVLPPGLEAVLDVKDPRAAGPVCELLGTGICDRALLWSQHPKAVRRFVSSGLGLEVALLRDTFTRPDHEQLLLDASRLGASAVSAHCDAVDAELVRQAQSAGLKVYAWCQAHHRHSVKLGIGLAGVVTDSPRFARSLGF